jgi:hypothetical protein
MIPFLTAVNISGTADFEAEGATFVNGLRSRDFFGPACVSVQEPRHIQYKGPSSHFWVDGSIDAPVNTAFKLRMRVTGAGNGWFQVRGVQYQGDGLWYAFVIRSTPSGAGFTLEAVEEEVTKARREGPLAAAVN